MAASRGGRAGRREAHPTRSRPSQQTKASPSLPLSPAKTHASTVLRPKNADAGVGARRVVMEAGMVCFQGESVERRERVQCGVGECGERTGGASLSRPSHRVPPVRSSFSCSPPRCPVRPLTPPHTHKHTHRLTEMALATHLTVRPARVRPQAAVAAFGRCPFARYVFFVRNAAWRAAQGCVSSAEKAPPGDGSPMTVLPGCQGCA